VIPDPENMQTMSSVKLSVPGGLHIQKTGTAKTQKFMKIKELQP
jgi:hypothetical protein